MLTMTERALEELLDGHGVVYGYGSQWATWKQARETLEARAGTAFAAGHDALASALRDLATEFRRHEHQASQLQDEAIIRLRAAQARLED